MKKITKVFISYHIEDVSFESSLKKELERKNILAMSINLYKSLGDDIFKNLQLEHALSGIDYSIIILSKAYLESEWLRTEAHALMGLQMNGRENFIVPIIIDDSTIPGEFKNVCDGFLETFDKGVEQVFSALTGIHTAFVVMKFDDKDLDSAYHGAIKLVAEEFEYLVTRIDQIEDSGHITLQLLVQIDKSEIIIAELTGDRPNCYYEVGYAQALGKEIILCRKEGDTIPFDLAGNRFIIWRTEQELREKLKKRFEAIRERLQKRNMDLPKISEAGFV